MIYKKLLTTVAAIGSMFLLANGAVAQQNDFFRIGTGSAGGTYFPIGGTIANAISNPPGARSCDEGGQCGVPGLIAIAQSTTASVQNNSAVQNGGLEAGLTTAATLYDMYKGTGKFEGREHPKLRVIANIYPEDLHLVLPKGASIEGLADLEGQRIGIGQAGSGTQVSVLQILEAYGITRDNMEEAELNLAQSAERLADGQIDAFFYAAGWPVAALVQLASTKGMELYSFSEEEISTISELIPTFSPSVIPAEAYEGIEKDHAVPAVVTYLVTSADLSDELIYKVTKALWNDNTRQLLDNGHAKGKQVTLETALDGVESLGVPLHTGAEQYYSEIGMTE